MHRKLFLLLFIVMAITIWFVFDLEQYIQGNFLVEIYRQYPWATTIVFFVATILVTAFPLPVAVVMTLTAGYLFGFWWGTLLISFASTLGATLACFMARTLFRGWVQRRFPSKAAVFDKGIEKDGAFYLFSLRLIPVVPFFMINLVMGLTKMPLITFYWVSQAGMLAGTAVYINAGTQLAKIESLSIEGILTPGLIGAFALLAVFPWIIRQVMRVIQSRKLYGKWKKPERFDYNLIVIGAGAAGLVSAYIASTVKAKVCLVEKNRMGGDCLNTGCIPSKTFLRSAKIKRLIERADEFGLKDVRGKVSFAAVMERVHAVIRKVEPHDSRERYTSMGVECVQGTAEICSPWEVSVDGKPITARNLIIASGGRPAIPPFPDLEKVRWYTSDTIWSLTEQPAHMLVLGGGPIGCELAQAFLRLGTKITLVDRMPFLLSREDEEVSQLLCRQFEREGMNILTGYRVTGFEADEHLQWAIVEDESGNARNLVFDIVLIAVGRTARTDELGLESMGISRSENGTIRVNEYMQTTYPNIYACGDVAGPYQFTHVAAHQAWYAAVNALFGRFKKFKADYSTILWCTFTDPEVAHVGLNEKEAQQNRIAYEVTRYPLDDLDRALADGETVGFVKVLTVPGKDKIIGVTIVGAHAGEMLGEFVLAMKYGLGLNKILGTVHAYPTYSEAGKFAAGEWKKAHAPQRVLRWMEKYHALMRKKHKNQPID